MAMKIRLARGGSKKRPFYSIVAADSRMPRDGRFIEKLGTYNPLLPKDSEDRVKMNMERVQYWLDQGAQPSDTVSSLLTQIGYFEKYELARRGNDVSNMVLKTTITERTKKTRKTRKATVAAVEAAAEQAPAEPEPAKDESKETDAEETTETNG